MTDKESEVLANRPCVTVRLCQRTAEQRTDQSVRMYNLSRAALNFSIHEITVNIANSFYTLEWYNITFLALFLTVFLCGTVGNVLVCLVIWKNPHMKNVTNVFILNLAIADLLVLVFALLPSMVQDIFRTWYLGDAGCKALSFLQRVSVIVSILTLIAISGERYYAICYPLSFNVTPTKVMLVLTFIWTLAMAFSCPELYFAKASNATNWVCGQETPSHIYLYIFVISFYVVPFLIMTAAYIKIARSLWASHVKQLSATGCRTRSGSEGVISQLIQRRRAARMLIAVVVCFFFCYLLHNVLIMVLLNANLETWNIDVLMSLITAGHLLIYVNSAANPVIYNFMSERFRACFLNVFTCCRACKNQSAEQFRLSSWRIKSDRLHREDTKASDI